MWQVTGHICCAGLPANTSFPTATEGMGITNITVTIKINPANGGRVAVPLSIGIVRSLWHAQRHAVRVVISGCRYPGAPVDAGIDCTMSQLIM